MNRRILAIALLIPFTLVTGYALLQVGIAGIFRQLFDGPGAWQIALDLVVALLLVLTWLVGDARATGRNPWPWVALTFATGSFGPLIYLATGGQRPARD